MKMKKTLAIILSIVMIVACLACLAGCDGDDTPDGKTKVTFWYWGSPAEIKVYEELIDMYMDDNPDIIIVPNHYESTVYMTKFQSETKKPDVFFMPDTDFAAWADGGVMLELDSYVTQAEIDSLWESGINEYYYNESTKTLGNGSGAHLYGFPKDLGPVTLAYNKTVLDRQIAANKLDAAEVYALLDPLTPMTWEQFATLCQRLTADQNKSAFNQIYGIPYYEMDAAVYSGGADYFDKNDPSKHGIDEAFIQAITYNVQLATKYQVMPTADQSGGNAYDMFENGRCIFTWIGPWDNADFWENQELVYDVIPVPYNGNIEGAKSMSFIGSMCYGISSQSKVKDEAVKFAKWLSMSTECQSKAMYLGQQVPNIKSMANAYVSDEGEWNTTASQVQPVNRSVFVDIMDNADDTYGYYAAAGKTDNVCGKTRSLYYTYNSTWKDNFTSYLATKNVWKMSDANQIRAALLEYRDAYQHDLDQMYKDWGRK